MSTQTTLEGVNQQWMHLTNALDDYLADLKRQVIQRLQEDGFDDIDPLVEAAKAQASSKKRVEETWLDWRVRVGLARPVPAPAPASAPTPVVKKARSGWQRPWYDRPLIRQLPNGQKVSTMSRMTAMILHAMCALGGNDHPVGIPAVCDYIVGHYPLFPRDLEKRNSSIRYRYEVTHFFGNQRKRKSPLTVRAGTGKYQLTKRGMAEANRVPSRLLQDQEVAANGQ